MVKIINNKNSFDNHIFYGNVGTGTPCLKGRPVPGNKLGTPRGVAIVEICHIIFLLKQLIGKMWCVYIQTYSPD